MYEFETYPFEHCVIENFYNPSKLEHVLGELILAEKKNIWKPYVKPDSKKYASRSWDEIGKYTKQMWEYFIGDQFIVFLRKITGIKDLVSDKNETFEAGNIGLLRQEGFLNIHADFNYNRGLKKYRRLNLLLYINKGWKLEYGGNLEIWDNEKMKCVKTVIPNFNTCVIFKTSDISLHGNPQPVNHPKKFSRKSLSVYYYSDEKPKDVGKHRYTTDYIK